MFLNVSVLIWEYKFLYILDIQYIYIRSLRVIVLELLCAHTWECQE